METPQRPQRRNEAIQGDPPDPITKEATVCAIIKAVHTTYCRFRTLSTATLHPKRLGALGYIPRAQMRGCASPFGPIMEWLPKSKTPLPLSKVSINSQALVAVSSPLVRLPSNPQNEGRAAEIQRQATLCANTNCSEGLSGPC